LGRRLAKVVPEVFSYALSFAVIGRYWVLHHRLFGDLERVDGRLTTLNLAYLAFVAFLPFPTEVLGEYGDEPHAVSLYAGCTAVVALLGVVMRLHAINAGLWKDGTTNIHRKREVALAYLSIPAVFLISIPIAYLVAPWTGMAFWLSLIFVGRSLRHFAAE